MSSPKDRDIQEYKYLCDLLLPPNPSPTSITTLDLSAKQHTTLPPPQLLFCFSNLRSLSLAYNKLDSFAASKLIQGAPFLKDLNLSYNHLKGLDDLIDLGAHKSLRSLNIIGNPVSDRYVRIRLIEFLLFPKKFQTHDPVKILTATYNLSSRNLDMGRKPDIIVSKSASKPRSASADKKARVPSGHQSQLIKLERERCPVPRKSRYPMLTMLNEQLVSIRDIQSIVVGKDINGLLFEQEKTPMKPPRSDKLHIKYIESYVKRKTQRREEETQVPTLKRLAHIMGADDDLVLLYSKDKMTYERKRTLRPDYEEELWKGPEDTRVKKLDFNIGITRFKESEKAFEAGKKERRKQEMDIPKKVRIKIDRNGKTKGGSRLEKSVSSLGSSVAEHESDISKESWVFPTTQAEEEEDDEEGVVDEPVQAQQEISPTLNKPNLRSRIVSLGKNNKDGLRSKSVLFDKDEFSQIGRIDSMGETGILRATRRTNSISVSSFSKLDAPGAPVSPGRDISASKRKENKKKFVVVKESTPNKGLPLFGYSHSQRQSKRSSSMHSTINKMNSFGVSMGEQSFGKMNNTSQDTKPAEDKTKNISSTNPLNSSRTSNGPEADAFFTFQQQQANTKTDQQKALVFLTQRKDSQISEKPEQVSFAGPIDQPVEEHVTVTQITTEQAVPLATLPSTGQPLSVKEFNRIPQAHQEKSISKHKEWVKPVIQRDNTLDIPRPQSAAPSIADSAINLFNKVHKTLLTSDSVRVLSARKKVKQVREREQEGLKFSKVIFLNRSNSVSLAGKGNQNIPSPMEKKEKLVIKPSHITTREQNPLVQKTVASLSSQSSFLSSRLSKNSNHSMMYTKRSRATRGDQVMRTCEDQSKEEERRSFGRGGMTERDELGLDSINSLTTMSHSIKKSQARSQSPAQITVMSYKANLVSPKKREQEDKRRYVL